MRCPDCNASFSELRDVCPACSNDLREYKTRHRIPVSFPDLPFDELIQKFPKTRNFTAAAAVEVTREKTPRDEVIDLFDAASAEIAAMPQREVALGTAQLGRTVDHAEVRLLFEVLDSTLFESARFVEEIQTSEAKYVESAELQEELDRFEEIAASPIFSLKRSRTPAHSSIQGMSTESRSVYKPTFLGKAGRVISAAIDGVMIAAVSLVLSFLLLHGYRREFFFENVSDIFIVYGDVISLAFGLIMPCATVYLLTMSFLSRRTIGLFFVGGVFSSREGRRASVQGLILRSILSPPSAVLSGFVYLCTGARGWHERLTEMDIVSLSRKRELPSS